LSGRGDAEAFATLLTHLFKHLYVRGKFSEALSLGQRILELAEQQTIPDYLRGITLSFLGVLKAQMGRAADGEALGLEGVSLLRRSPEHSDLLQESLLCIAIILREQGRYADARKYAEEAHAGAEASGDLPRASFALYHIGRLAFLQGDLDRAAACLGEAVKQGTAIGSIETTWSSLIFLAAVRIRRGNLLEAAESLKAADRLWREMGGQIISLFLNVVGAFVARVQPVDAVRIYGVVAAHGDAIGAAIVNEPWIAEVKRDLREELGEKTFQEAYDTGRRLSIDDAMELMRDALDQFERSSAH
jgi:tetratricopeptide (TPR) repeat protein